MAIICWTSGAEGVRANEFEGLLEFRGFVSRDVFPDLLSLDPRTEPSTTAMMAINPNAPPKILFFLEVQRTWG